MGKELRVRPARDAAELLSIVEPLEPHTTLIAGRLRDRELGREDRAFIVEDTYAAPAGAVLLSRLCFDRWYAKPMLLHARAAPLLARTIDRSRSRGVLGPEEHVGALIPHLRRVQRSRTMPWAWVPPPLPAPRGPLDPRTRLATAADLEALVDLYRGFELDPVPPRRIGQLLAQMLERNVVVVAEGEGRLVAAMRAETQSRHYMYWGGLTVRPENRNEGLARSVILRTHAVTRAFDLGYIVVRATGRAPRPDRRTTFNPLLQRPGYRELGATGTWSMVSLAARPTRRILGGLQRRITSPLVAASR